MTQDRGLFMEFLIVAALVTLAGVGVVFLAAIGQEGGSVASALLDVVKMGFGALVALAYAARNIVKKPDGPTDGDA